MHGKTDKLLAKDLAHEIKKDDHGLKKLAKHVKHAHLHAAALKKKHIRIVKKAYKAMKKEKSAKKTILKAKKSLKAAKTTVHFL